MAIKFVTDSTAYLPQETLDAYDVKVVPLKVLFGDRVYRDGMDLSNNQFYRMLSEARKLPTTSQPAVGEFERVYGELLDQGHEIISVHISGKLSGTVESARSAAEQFSGAPIRVVDSLSTAFGLAMMITEITQIASEGYDTASVLRRLDQMIRDTEMYFVVDTLEYLEKGGRIGAARALLGTLLKIKPVLMVEDGLIVPLSSVRTKRKAIAFMLEQASRSVERQQHIRLAVAHGQVPDEMDELLAMIHKRFGSHDVFTSEVGPVIGTHTGPGVLGMAVCPIHDGH